MNSATQHHGGEQNKIAQQGAWDIILCAQQVTVGTVALIPRDHDAPIHAIPKSVMGELPEVIGAVQDMLRQTLRPDDCTMLLTQEKQVGGHVLIIPRFASKRQYAGMEFEDAGWPALPNMNHVHPVDAARREGLMTALVHAWPNKSTDTTESA